MKPNELNNNSKKEQIAKMFDDISDKYDLLNGVLSFGIHKYWRRRLVKDIKKLQPDNILDVATGTGDLALALTKTKATNIIGVDISEKMLEIGKQKIAGVQNSNVQMMKGDGEDIPFEDNLFDVVTVAFGIRNFENRVQGLKEMYRVLKTNGTLVILEFSMPKNPTISFFYRLYTFRLLPLVGKFISGNNYAYTYLPQSVDEFPSSMEFRQELRTVGFQNVNVSTLTFGVANIYKAQK
ncbi:MAG: bifunctional demethylmenaquinone methyltransferase/2-methoxy-6-polyprenyl-1,4-benzoquinol methylase UbiE [Prevotellaceae bacterium]|nr:bifunctional demethylmenaquinone methyltransferase/2-methoxy-6-polyprenyl-1,4-benzoquinol methylase UbiE [Prevotellaceae bacterium]